VCGSCGTRGVFFGGDTIDVGSSVIPILIFPMSILFILFMLRLSGMFDTDTGITGMLMVPRLPNAIVLAAVVVGPELESIEDNRSANKVSEVAPIEEAGGGVDTRGHTGTVVGVRTTDVDSLVAPPLPSSSGSSQSMPEYIFIYTSISVAMMVVAYRKGHYIVLYGYRDGEIYIEYFIKCDYLSGNI